MDKRTIVKTVNFLEKRLKEKGIEVSRIILFGSQAKKTATKYSDLDLIIVSENFRKKNIFKRAEMIGDAVFQTVCEFDIPIDVLLKSPDEIDDKNIKETGVVVYAA